MAGLSLLDYFVMGEAIGIVATLFVSFYYSSLYHKRGGGVICTVLFACITYTSVLHLL